MAIQFIGKLIILLLSFDQISNFLGIGRRMSATVAASSFPNTLEGFGLGFNGMFVFVHFSDDQEKCV